MMRNQHTMRDAVSASGEMTVDWGPQGLQITDGRPRPVWGRITGVAAATNRYSWTQVNESDSTLPDLGSGFAGSGTTDVGQWPAYEVTGNTLVSVGTKVMLWPSPSGQFWIFFFPTAITAGGLTVSEVDLAPSYTSITTVRFDQADGFVVSQPAAGIARIDQTPASATTVGYVTTGTQTFNGDKTVQGNFFVTLDTQLGGNFDVTGNSVFRDYVTMQGVLTVADDGTAGGVWAGDPLLRVYDSFTNGGGYDGALNVRADVAYVDITDRVFALWGGTGASTQPGQAEINGVIKFRGIADATAPTSSLYYSTTANKLVYKDGGGTVNNLY